MEVPKENTNWDRVRFQLKAKGVPQHPPNPLRSGIHSRGYLPHVKREGASYFVTFRLADSLPREVLIKFLAEKTERLRDLEGKLTQGRRGDSLSDANQMKTKIERDYRRKVEGCLDQGHGSCFLREPKIAQLVADSLLHFHSHHYLLDEWVIMPNHVHLIVCPLPNFTLSNILKSRKQFTATMANRILGRTGQPFWQAESYDHWIREEEEIARI